MADYTIQFNESEVSQITHQAEIRGYSSVMEYLRALVTADALVNHLKDDWQDADEDARVLEAGFRQSWHEAMTGDVSPVETLWDNV